MTKEERIQAIERIIENKRDFGKNPNYLLHSKLYPSSGVERMNEQQNQLTTLATAIEEAIGVDVDMAYAVMMARLQIIHQSKEEDKPDNFHLSICEAISTNKEVITIKEVVK